MITVEKAMSKEGYLINIPKRELRSKSMYVETIEEVAEAVKHYYGAGKNHNKVICPFCKIIMEVKQ